MMTYNNLTVNDLVERAMRTSDISEMINLIKSPYMLVRRALAKNSNTPRDMINTLALDPVLNVSYMALNNSKSTVTRSLDSQKFSPCVTCKIDENKLLCTQGCERKEDHSF